MKDLIVVLVGQHESSRIALAFSDQKHTENTYRTKYLMRIHVMLIVRIRIVVAYKYNNKYRKMHNYIVYAYKKILTSFLE